VRWSNTWQNRRSVPPGRPTCPASPDCTWARAFYAAMGWPADGRVRDLTADGVTISEVRYVIRLGWRKPYLYLPRG
jgi:hypothetical protein